MMFGVGFKLFFECKIATKAWGEKIECKVFTLCFAGGLNNSEFCGVNDIAE